MHMSGQCKDPKGRVYERDFDAFLEESEAAAAGGAGAGM
jgi:hypothetical protein